MKIGLPPVQLLIYKILLNNAPVLSMWTLFYYYLTRAIQNSIIYKNVRINLFNKLNINLTFMNFWFHELSTILIYQKKINSINTIFPWTTRSCHGLHFSGEKIIIGNISVTECQSQILVKIKNLIKQRVCFPKIKSRTASLIIIFIKNNTLGVFIVN